MDRPKRTRKNDSVTLRQFNRFLITANIPSQFKGTVKELKDVLEMPIILQAFVNLRALRDSFQPIYELDLTLISAKYKYGFLMQFTYIPHLGDICKLHEKSIFVFC